MPFNGLRRPNGCGPHTVTTVLTCDVVRQIFEREVAIGSWVIVDRSNPMIARNAECEIALGVRSDGLSGTTVAVISPGPMPPRHRKERTVRRPMNRFLIAVHIGDLHAVVEQTAWESTGTIEAPNIASTG